MAKALQCGGIADDDRAAVDRRDDLDRVEAEARHVAEATDHAAVGAAAEGVGGVLDDAHAAPLGQRVQLLEPAGDAAEVQRHDRLRPRPQQRGRLVGVETERRVLDVAEHRRRAGRDDRLVIGDEVERRRDDLVAAAHAGRQQAQVQGGGAGVGRQHVARVEAQEARQPVLEGLSHRAHAEPAGVQRVHHRLDRVEADVRLEDRHRRLISHRRTSGSRPART